MAVENFQSTLAAAIANDTRMRPIDEHGKKRIVFFELPATTIVGDAGSTIELGRLPPGAVRVLLQECYVQTTALGAARVMSVGHRPYSKNPPDAAEEPQNYTAFASGIDMATAAVRPFVPAALKYDVYSRAGVMLVAQVTGGTIPVGAVIRGYVTYVYE